MGHYPFGESWYNVSADKLIFTTYERDSESGNDYAMARMYVPRLTRISIPDPAGTAAVDPSNPQTWNRYSYVFDEPIALTDPSGACPPGYRSLSPDERTALINAADPKNWEGWTFGMPSDLANKKIDCSTFINQSANNAGILIPWVGATQFGATPTFSPIKNAADLQPGDVIQFLTPGGTHSAIASSTGTSFNFIGSQTSTGPREVQNWTANAYWNGSRYQQDPTKGAYPSGYYEICVPVNAKIKKRKGGAGGGSGTGGDGLIFFEPTFAGWEGGISFGIGQWVWWPTAGHHPMNVL